MSQGPSNKKVSNGLVALSSAAILAVYTAGYSRTKAAADRFSMQSEVRRPAIPVLHVEELKLPTVAEVPSTAAPPIVPKREPVVPNAAKPAPPKPAMAEVSSTPPVETPSSIAAQPPAATETHATLTPPVAVPALVVVEQKPEPKTEVAVVVPAPPVVPAEPPKPAWKDGTYTGWGTSRHGNIEASVVIESGRIASAVISQCLTRYSCSVIAQLPPEVPQRQGPDVDTVSGATQSADAFYYAVANALAKAK